MTTNKKYFPLRFPILSIFICILFSAQVLYAQTDWRSKAKAVWNKDEFEQANTAATAIGLSDEEITLYLLTNLARQNGKKFYQELVEPFLNETQKTTTANVRSLKTDLAKIKGLPMLKVNDGLCKAATFHASDMGETGGVSHDSSDGTACFTRIEKYYDGGAMAENCSYGYSKAMDILMQLLIDEGVPSLGHRTNILGLNYTQMGIGIRPHKIYGHNCVMDFSN